MMSFFPETIVEWILGIVLILSSILVLLLKKPVHACLSFLLTLLTLSILYLELHASFIAVLQIIVYAGAILVLFMFVIVLFQDAHEQIAKFKAESSRFLLGMSLAVFFSAAALLGYRLINPTQQLRTLPAGFGEVESLGKALYVDFFFPFEAVILLFLIAVIGALYIAKKERDYS